MRKGVVFTMDAVFALYVALLLLTTFFFMLEAKQSSEDIFYLSRIARDVYEVNYSSEGTASIILPSGLSTSCTGKNLTAVEPAVVYDDNGVLKYQNTTVCIS